MQKLLAYIIIALCVLHGGNFLANAAEKTAEKTKEPLKPPRAMAAPAVKSSTNEITKGFVSSGVLNCAARVNQVTGFLSADNSGVGAFLFLPPNPDSQMVSTSMEIIGADKKSVYTSATFAPNQANGCGAVYEAIAWWPDKCDVVANKQFAGKKVESKLKQDIGILDITATTRIFLMPTTDGCISIKKELVQ